jgi:supervillin
VITIDEGRGQAHDAFWNLLGGVGDYQDVGPEDEDLLYETFLAETNIVYRVEGNSLIPVEEYWGASLKYEMLKSNEVRGQIVC